MGHIYSVLNTVIGSRVVTICVSTKSYFVADIIGRAIKAVEDFDTSDSEDDIFSFNYDQPSHGK